MNDFPSTSLALNASVSWDILESSQNGCALRSVLASSVSDITKPQLAKVLIRSESVPTRLPDVGVSQPGRAQKRYSMDEHRTDRPSSSLSVSHPSHSFLNLSNVTPCGGNSCTDLSNSSDNLYNRALPPAAPASTPKPLPSETCGRSVLDMIQDDFPYTPAPALSHFSSGHAISPPSFQRNVEKLPSTHNYDEQACKGTLSETPSTSSSLPWPRHPLPSSPRAHRRSVSSNISCSCLFRSTSSSDCVTLRSVCQGSSLLEYLALSSADGFNKRDYPPSSSNCGKSLPSSPSLLNPPFLNPCPIDSNIPGAFLAPNGPIDRHSYEDPCAHLSCVAKNHNDSWPERADPFFNHERTTSVVFPENHFKCPTIGNPSSTISRTQRNRTSVLRYRQDPLSSSIPLSCSTCLAPESLVDSHIDWTPKGSLKAFRGENLLHGKAGQEKSTGVECVWMEAMMPSREEHSTCLSQMQAVDDCPFVSQGFRVQNLPRQSVVRTCPSDKPASASEMSWKAGFRSTPSRYEPALLGCRKPFFYKSLPNSNQRALHPQAKDTSNKTIHVEQWNRRELSSDAPVSTCTMLLEELRASSRSSGQAAIDYVSSRTLRGYLGSHSQLRELELKDIGDRIVEFAMDQHGSRFIQQKLISATDDERKTVLRCTLSNAHQLITDVFGNYVVQKLLELGGSKAVHLLYRKLKGSMLAFTLHMYGCRVIQKALEVLGPSERVLLVRELDGHVLDCIRDQNGNHVIQKCVELLHFEAIEFITLSVRGQAVSLACHSYGCRVVQRILEHGSKDQKMPLLNEIMSSVRDLIKDQYGNYVIQHVVEHGYPKEKQEVISIVTRDVCELSLHKFASNVVEMCLQLGSYDEKRALVDIIIGKTDTGLSPLHDLVRDQFGNYVVQRVLDVAPTYQREQVVQILKSQVSSIKKYSYGKHIISRLDAGSAGRRNGRNMTHLV